MTSQIDYMGGYAGGRKFTVYSFPRPPTTTAKPKKHLGHRLRRKSVAGT